MMWPMKKTKWSGIQQMILIIASRVSTKGATSSQSNPLQRTYLQGPTVYLRSDSIIGATNI